MMEDYVIITHTDCDGILSAAQLRSALGQKVPVFFPEWVEYGVSARLLENVPPCKHLFVCDMGLDAKSVGSLTGQGGKFKEITVIDHHPHEEESRKKLEEAGIEVIYDDEYCASGLVHLYLRKNKLVKKGDFAEKWAIIGTYADVLITKEKSALMVSEMLLRHPELSLEQVFWGGSGRGEYEYPLPSMLGAVINSGHRLHYHFGAAVALEAAREIEDYGDVFLLRSDFGNEHLEARYPHAFMLTKWYDLWLSERKKVFEKENIEYYKFKVGSFPFGVAIIEHPWDIGGYVSTVKSGDTLIVFTINYGTPKKAKISVRKPSADSKKIGDVIRRLHLGEIMRNLSHMNPAFEGGGHQEAGSCTFPKEFKPTQVIRLLKLATKITIDKTFPEISPS